MGTRVLYLGLHSSDSADSSGFHTELGRGNDTIASGYFRRLAIFRDTDDVTGGTALSTVLSATVVFDQILSYYPPVTHVALYTDRAKPNPLLVASLSKVLTPGPGDRILFGLDSLEIREDGIGEDGLLVARVPLVLPEASATYHLLYNPMRVHRVWTHGAPGGVLSGPSVPGETV